MWLNVLDERHFVNTETGELHLGNDLPADRILDTGTPYDMTKAFLVGKMVDGIDIISADTGSSVRDIIDKMMCGDFVLSALPKKKLIWFEVGGYRADIVIRNRKMPASLLRPYYANAKSSDYRRVEFNGELLMFCAYNDYADARYAFRIGDYYVIVFHALGKDAYVVLDRQCKLVTVCNNGADVLIPENNINKKVNSRLLLMGI